MTHTRGEECNKKHSKSYSRRKKKKTSCSYVQSAAAVSCPAVSSCGRCRWLGSRAPDIRVPRRRRLWRTPCFVSGSHGCRVTIGCTLRWYIVVTPVLSMGRFLSVTVTLRDSTVHRSEQYDSDVAVDGLRVFQSDRSSSNRSAGWRKCDWPEAHSRTARRILLLLLWLHGVCDYVVVWPIG